MAKAGSRWARATQWNDEVPRREPRVLPLVGHRHDVEGLEVAPARVAARPAGRRWRGLRRIAVEPAADVVVEQLLAPQHPGERLAHHHRGVVATCPAASARRRTRRPRRGAPRGPRRSRPRAPPPPPAVRRPAGATAGGSRPSRRVRPARGTRATPSCRPGRGSPSRRRPTTWSLMASLGWAGPAGSPNRRAVFVSFSQNRATGSVPSGAGPASSSSGAEERMVDRDRRPPSRPAATASRLRCPTTTCCGTRPSAGRARCRSRPRRSSPAQSSAGPSARPWRSRPRRSSSGRRRTRPCRAARTRDRACPAGRSRRRGRRRGTPAGGSGSASGSRRGSARRRGTTSAP